MQKSKIEWCDMTWNPVTGCRNACTYCYARRIAKRFEGYNPDITPIAFDHSMPLELDEPLKLTYKDNKAINAPYPFGFEPTLHRYRFSEPSKVKKGQNIFVCSMADLFGPWVPTKWILDVFDVCSAAPQHNYMFLTKYYHRYEELDDMALLPHQDNFWYGTTAVNIEDRFFNSSDVNTFLSIEPIQMRLGNVLDDNVNLKWIIVGAETGNRKGKIKPKKEWIVDLAMACETKISLFMKDSLKDVYGDELIQELPKGLLRNRK